MVSKPTNMINGTGKPPQQHIQPNKLARRWRSRLAFWLPAALVGYVAFLATLTIPSFQRNLLYLNRVNVPIHANMSHPELYGLAPYKTRNFYLNTTDGESVLGVWHVLPHSVYREAAAAQGAGSPGSANRQLFAPLAPLGKDVFEESFKKRDTVIYFHGNACNRAISYRVGTYKALSTKLDVNVIAIDYRGYGDSTGSPSEDGLLSDATTVWEYINTHSSRKTSRSEQPVQEEGKSIVVMGHSLGTAVSSRLAGYLADRGVNPKAIILIAPFTSLPELLTTYRLAGLPLIGPLTVIPAFYNWLVKCLQDTWMSKDHLIKTKAPVLIIHAKDDHDIPASHSKRLFEMLSKSRAPEGAVTQSRVVRREGWGSVMLHVPDEGRDGDDASTHNGGVAWFEADHGAHNRVGGGEGVIQLMQAFLESEAPSDLAYSILGGE